MKITKQMLRNLIIESLQEMEDPQKAADQEAAYLAGEREAGEKELFQQMYDEQDALVAELQSVIEAVKDGKNPKDVLSMLEGTMNALRAAIGEEF
jgi:hypothetical protein